jgi:hypothetical protein
LGEDGCNADVRVSAAEFGDPRRFAAAVRVDVLRADGVAVLPAALRPVVVRFALGLAAVVREVDFRAAVFFAGALPALPDFAVARLAAGRFVVLRFAAACFVVARLAVGRLAVLRFVAAREDAAFLVATFRVAVFLVVARFVAAFAVADFFLVAPAAPARFAAGLRALEVFLLAARLLVALRAVVGAFVAARLRVALLLAAVLVAFFAVVFVAFFAAPRLLADFLVVAIGLLRVGSRTE